MNFTTTKFSVSALILASLFATSPAWAITDAELASLASITNIQKVGWNARRQYEGAIRNSAKDFDMESFSKIVDLLAKDDNGRVNDWSFPVWRLAAEQMVWMGQEQRKKKPEEQTELMKGFREGGTTFGLWQGAEGVERIDGLLTQGAVNLLTKKMPQKDLPLSLQLSRDETVLSIMNRAGNAQQQKKASKTIENFAFTAKPTDEKDNDVIIKAITTVLNAYVDRKEFAQQSAVAKSFAEKRKDIVAATGMDAAMYAREMGGYFRALNEKAYRAKLAGFGKYPLDMNMLKALRAFSHVMSYHNPQTDWQEIISVSKPFIDQRGRLFKGKDLQDAQRFAFDTYCSAGDIEKVISLYAEMTATYDAMAKAYDNEKAREKAAREKEQEARKNNQPLPPPFVFNKEIVQPNNTPGQARWHYLATLRKFDCYKEVVAVFDESFKEGKLHQNDLWNLAFAYAKIGDKAGAVAACDRIVSTNTTLNVDQKFAAAAFKEYLLAKGTDDLIRRLQALRPMSDKGAKEGSDKIALDTRFFNMMRAASRNIMMLDSSEKSYDYVKAIEKMTWDMLHPEEKIVYNVRYVKDAPGTANAALITDLFSKLPTENRFARYNAYNNFDKGSELKRMKSGEAPHLNADVEGKEGMVAAAYNDNGLHIYIKVNDPDAWKTKAGLKEGVGFEYSIMPGEDKPWHWNMFNTSKLMENHGVVWDSPRKGFKVAMEYVREDFYIADKCHVAHIFFPWELFAYELPKNGDTWRFALIGGWAGQFGALGGGAVHEMGRAMQMKFNVTPQEEKAIKLGLLRAAVREYGKVRSLFENADFWVDPHLGDPEFYEAVVKPYLTELDEVKKDVTSDNFDLNKVDSYLDNYLEDLVDFRLRLDAKRSAYLKAKLKELK